MSELSDFNPKDKMCEIHGIPLPRRGMLYYACPKCLEDAQATPAPTVREMAAIVNQGLDHQGEPCVTIKKNLYDGLLKYYQQGEKARVILRRLGNGSKGMTLLQTVEALANSIRDSNGISPTQQG